MPGVKYTFSFEGLQKGASDMAFAESAARKLGTTLAAIQGVRAAIPGLATATPSALSGGGAGGYILQSNALLSAGARSLGRMGSIVPLGPSPLTLQSQFNQSMGIGSGQMRLTGQARASYANFWQSAVPPMIPPRQGPNWAMAGLGALAAPFSPWLGARGLSNAFGGLMGGGGGGKLGGAATAIFGPGGLPVFMAAFVGIRITTEALRLAFESLIKSVQQGAKIFQSAARIGRGPGFAAGLEGSMGSIGVSGAAIEQMMIKGEYPSKNGRSLRINDEMLSAWKGVLPTGQLQQIQNLKPYLETWMHNMGGMAEILGRNSKAAFETEFAWKELTFALESSMSEIIHDAGPALVAVFQELGMWIKGLTALWEGFKSFIGVDAINALITKYNVASGALPGNVPDFKGGNLGGGPPHHSHISAWERMGFVIGGGGGNDYAKQTAQNTAIIARVLTKQDTTAAKMTGLLTGLRFGFNLP